MSFRTDYRLEELNTFRLKSSSEFFIALDDLALLPEIHQLLKTQPKLMVLGGGSNILLPDYFNGTIIHNCLRGIFKIATNDDEVLVKVMAGEIWDDFVAYTVTNGWYGLENLSLIPGTVGASPIQNIGAYGAEVKDFIAAVEVYDLLNCRFITIDNEECEFSYRNSRFKREAHLVVTAVIFKLNTKFIPNLSYADLAKQITQFATPTAIDVRNTVITIRKNKLPDPKVIGNVGSFFHNPIIAKEYYEKLLTEYPNLPGHPTIDGQIKISAGWLIDNAGLKGYRALHVGVYEKQALVLVNLGGATQNDVLGLASMIQDTVFEKYGIRLNIEPQVIR